MTDNAIVVQGNTFIEPAASLDALNRRYTMFNSFVKQNLREGIDFQVIPGTGVKPSLVKPGAEKLCTLFGLSARFQIADKVEDWTGAEHGGEPFFYYRYRCGLYRSDLLVSECEGSCNSWEKKYRYRSAEVKCPSCGKSTIIKGKEDYGGGWLCFAKKGGCGAKYPDNDRRITDQPRGQVTNADIADQVNTLQKMAQKRAFVGATLLATNASEFFTQDIEDMPQFVEAEYVEVQPVVSTQTNKTSTQTNKIEQPAPKPEAPAAPDGDAALLAAMNEKDDDGNLYGSLPTEKLSHMFNSLVKTLKRDDLTDEERVEKNRKRVAAKLVMDSRQPK